MSAQTVLKGKCEHSHCAKGQCEPSHSAKGQYWAGTFLTPVELGIMILIV